MEITITNIKRTPRVSKTTGKEFVSVGIQTNQHGTKWLSGFANVENADWEVGTTTEIEVETKGEYLNFKMPKRDMSPAARSPETAELKNILTLMVIPAIDKNFAMLNEIKFKIDALGDRLEKLINPPEDNFQEPDL